MDKANIPNHVAIIMDGNRRWAKEKGIDYRLGHKEGAKTLEKIVRYANSIGLEYITVYAFSTENWKRSEDEVSALMTLLKNYLDDYSKRADSENIKVNVWGDITVLKEGLRNSIIDCMERTKDNTGVNFNICLNYGSQEEIIDASIKLAQDINKGLDISNFKREDFYKYLYHELPPIDLLIRTGGELRLSNFMLYQMSYAEFYFTNVCFPDFDEREFDKALDDYANRDRKFGKVKERE